MTIDVYSWIEECWWK